jgi:hypothetical protein
MLGKATKEIQRLQALLNAGGFLTDDTEPVTPRMDPETSPEEEFFQQKESSPHDEVNESELALLRYKVAEMTLELDVQREKAQW